MRITKSLSVLFLALTLSSCIGNVIGVAVDTTTEIIKVPFVIAGTVLGVAADTTGAVIATPIRVIGAAVGVDHDHPDSDPHRDSDQDD
jgi:prepilin signal peptidase PulO-like enzyme (type II secretory pathway)|tara:strand:- start:215 stop:478 length:264 start_codon:yes stop_codon:yes gene_type:complete